METQKTKIGTATYLVRDGKVYLPIKLTVVGIGKRFTYGGKVEPGETILQSAKRELLDESGIEVDEIQLKHMGTVYLYKGKEKDDVPFYKVYFFVCNDFIGEPSVDERELTDVQAFPIDDLPLKDLKAGDEFFMIPILQEKKVAGWVWFENDDVCHDHDIQTVEELSLP